MIDIGTLQQTLENRIIGKTKIEYHTEVTSTNDVAIELGKSGKIEEGTLILAEHQTAGRGRFGRTWQAPYGKCILASIVFRYRLKQEHIHLPNLLGALSIAQGIHTITGLAARIKHPNDVRIDKKKVAGVLTEIEYDKNRHPFFVLGFGVNVNISRKEFPIELRNIATSLQFAASESGDVKICRTSILRAILHRLEENYLNFKSNNIRLVEKQVKLWEETT